MSRYDVAIVGMGCVLPKANSIEQYWQNIKSGDTYFTQMPKHLWHMENYYSPDKNRTDKTYTVVGSFVEGFEFPAIKYRIPPNALEGVDPAQLMAVEATREALEDAGIPFRSEQLVDAITVFGSSGVDQFAHSTAFLKRHEFLETLLPELQKRGVKGVVLNQIEEQLPAELKKFGHSWTPSVAAVGSIPSSVSNRVAQIFGIGGMNMTVDAACASSFVAVDAGCHALMAGDARIAIVGGADLGTNPPIYIGFSSVNGLSETGMSCPFDHTANGLVIGEGVATLVLKRLEDALEDGDNVRAVIRGIGASSDGAGQAIYAPSVEGRAEALNHALNNAETHHSDVQYLEAHATSTVVGDANEYDAISTVYGKDRKNPEPLYLGSVKQQIGHLKAAAGVAGLIKTVLAMENETIPHMPRFTKLTPHATMQSEHLAIPSKTLPWKVNEHGYRVGAVTTSGFGGVNYHAIVEQGSRYEKPPKRPEISREMAIVGVNLRVAGADSPEEFWDNLSSGKNSFSKVDPKQMGWEYSYDRGPAEEMITTHSIAKMKEYKFNSLRHKIFPNAISQISPTQLLGVDLCDQLLVEKGLELSSRKNIGVSLGSMHDDYFPTIYMPMLVDEIKAAVKGCECVGDIDDAIVDESFEVVRDVICQKYPPVTEHTLPGWMTNVTAGRIANKLNLSGPNYTVDSACSSGLASFVPAIYQLMFGNVDMMITGGLNLQTSDTFTSGVCALGAIAEETARPFDETGKGFLIGEGGVIFLIKRLADAKRDGDDILAIVHSVDGSSESDSRSMVAPTTKAVERSISNAMRKTHVKPVDIGVCDTHGSANELSDIVEAKSIAAQLRADKKGEPIQITAVKSHVGHLYGGSGASSLLSVIWSLKEKQVPGIRNLNNIRPVIKELSEQVEPRKGTKPMSNKTVAGAVNSLGLGGANYFGVVSLPEAGLSDQAVTPRSTSKPVVSGGTSVRATDKNQNDIFLCLAEGKQGFAAAISRALKQEEMPSIISEGDDITARMTVTYDSPEKLKSKLTSVLKMLDGGHDIKPLESQGVFAMDVPPAEDPNKLAFCFPGQGVHYISMGRFLYEENPTFKAVVDRVHTLAMESIGFDLLGHIYGDPKDEKLHKNLATLAGAQISLFSIEVGLYRVFEEMGIVPDVMVGHSFGEISAMTAAGVWDLDTGFKVVVERVNATKIVMDGDGPALGMMSLVCTEEQRDAILNLVGDKVVLTNINAPGRFILSGEKDAVIRTVSAAESFGADAKLLPIGSAFHSKFMEPAREPFKVALSKLPCKRPSIPILSTITGEYIEFDDFTSENVATHLSNQLVTKLNLPREINRLYDEGVKNYLEIGPKWAMTKMIDAILAGRPYNASFTLHPKVGDVETFRRARAFLFALGKMESAAGRQNVPGMFSEDFLEYMDTYEPAVLSLLEEVHARFMNYVKAIGTGQEQPRAVKPVAAPGARADHIAKPTVASAPTPSTAASSAQKTAPVQPQSVTKKVVKKKTAAQDVDVWISRLKEKLVATTGYPEDMLEVDLDLEADLGVDSVQRAEIWVALTTEYGLEEDVRPEGKRTITNLASTLAKMAGGDSEEVVEVEEVGTVETAKAAVQDSVNGPAQATAVTSDSAGGDVDVWISRLKEKLVATTGYPEDMLEVDLDLEADLGVDSVQRAEIWVALTTEHGLDGDVRPEGKRTITNLASTLAKMAGGDSTTVVSDEVAPVEPEEKVVSSPQIVSGGNAVVWEERLKEKLVATTGYPAEMLEVDLDLEADLGVDSVQRAEIWVALTTEYSLDGDVRPEGPRTIANLAKTLAGMSSENSAGAEDVSDDTVIDSEAKQSNVESVEKEPVAPSGSIDSAVWEERLKEKLVATTGYPAEMLEVDLDLEADLGVDSVQRAEIWVALTTEYALDGDVRPQGPRTIANLAKTLAGMAASKTENKQEEEQVTTVSEATTAPDKVDEEGDCQLFVTSTKRLDNSELTESNCKAVLAVIADDSAAAKQLDVFLAKREISFATVNIADVDTMGAEALSQLVDECDTLVYMAHENAVNTPAVGSELISVQKEQTKFLYQVFRKLVPVLAEKAKRLIFPIAMDGSFGLKSEGNRLLGAFPAGFVRSLDRELPDCSVQLIDAGEMTFAEAVDANILVQFRGLEIGMTPVGRVVPILAKVAPSSSHQNPLDKDDLVLVTGGARGIVFECVLQLAKQTGCQLVLTGRTELPMGRPEWLSVSADEIDKVIKEMEINLVRNEGIKLPQAKRIGATARSQWELSRNLDILEKNGIEVRYETCDVSDSDAILELVKDISKTGNIAGIVHGSGVQKAKVVTELTDEAINRTLDTKITPLFTFLDVIDWSKIKLLSTFGSIAGLFGNAGQTDYGLANDMLSWAVSGIGAIYPHVKVQTVDWTAWKGTGMVSDEESKRFEQAGLTLLTVENGVSLYMEAVTGAVYERLAVFNESAAFASGRPASEHVTAAHPRKKLVEPAKGEQGPTVYFSINEDVYIKQHLVNTEPVVPGTFVTEIFSEVVKGEGLSPIDIQFRRPLQLRGDELHVEVIRDGDEMSLVPVDRPNLEKKALANLSYASCKLGESNLGDISNLVFSDDDVIKLREIAAETGATFYSLLDDKFSSALKTGPVFRGILSTMEKGDLFYALLTVTHEAASLLEVPGEFVFNPVVADMAVQVGAAWALQTQNAMEIPFEIGLLHTEKEMTERDAIVVCSAREMSDEQTIVDLVVRDLSGNLIMAMERLVLKTILKG